MPTILEVVCHTTGMGFATIARVTPERWIACEVLDRIEFGLGRGGELEIATTLCNEVRGNEQAIAIDHVETDAIYCGHPTPAQYGFQSYIAVPIRLSDGSFFGTLCAIDPKPAEVNNSQVLGMFALFARLIAANIDAKLRLDRAEASLTDERDMATLREQFIAVLGHDLRNPIASVDAGLRLLGKEQFSEQGRQIVANMRGSAKRMLGLIDDLADFTRGRLGNGIVLADRKAVALRPVLEQVVTELQSVHPDREIECDLDLDHEVECDAGRMGQLASNLLANALTHGAPSRPVHLAARSRPDGLELSVRNEGAAIPEATRKALFQPFVRGEEHGSAQGLGLGLYIADQVARAHDATLAVRSNDLETVFTLSMPRSPAG